MFLEELMNVKMAEDFEKCLGLGPLFARSTFYGCPELFLVVEVAH